MNKKKYEVPQVDTFLIEGTLPLAASPISTGEGGKPAGSRSGGDSSWEEDE